MEIDNLLRHFMSDDLSLQCYLKGKVVDSKKLKDHLVLTAHNYNHFIPDHYYDALLTKIIQESKTNINPPLKEYFIRLLPSLACNYLTMNGNDICVKDGMWNEWQIVAREFSPSFLKVLFVWNIYNKNNNIDYNDIINNNFQYTCLPVSENAFINTLKNSLYDSHVHAGSSLEADIVWLNILFDASFFIGSKNVQVDLYQQNGLVKSREDMYLLTVRAKRLIDYLNESIRGRYDNYLSKTNYTNLKNGGVLVKRWFSPDNHLNPIQEEARLIFKALASLGKGNIASLLHYYLLIKGTFRKFMVNQSFQYGLEQFNHTLHTPFRGATMDYLKDSLTQMAGNNLKDAKGIELRVSPQFLKQIDIIKNAINNLNSLQNSNEKTTVSLICHFIKGQKIEDSYKYIEDNFNKLSGIDVAGRDYLASPEDYIDIFERLRKNKHASHLRYTYHAGEDFFHILDGLRTIYEAITFLNFSKNDRIGHASAAGVSPDLWADNLDESFPISIGRYLDDLIFAYHLIDHNNLAFREDTKGALKQRIETLLPLVGYKVSNIEDSVAYWLSHDKQRRNTDKYKKIIEVKCFELFNQDELIMLQKEILKVLKEKEIAIETTPTSNVSIGHHRTFRSYHLITWLKWKEQDVAVPDIVVGSDETGVFPTNIANEYANIYDLLKKYKFQNAEVIMKDLVEKSKLHIFQNIQR